LEQTDVGGDTPDVGDGSSKVQEWNLLCRSRHQKKQKVELHLY